MPRHDGQSGNSSKSGNRGFAAMDAEQQRAIASRGGRAAHEQGTAHQFSPEEARAAGRKGGQAAHQSGKAHEFTSEEARIAGRKGGQASHGSSKVPTQQGDNDNTTDQAHMQSGNMERQERKQGDQSSHGHIQPDDQSDRATGREEE